MKVGDKHLRLAFTSYSIETRTCFFGNNEKLPDRREKHPITVAYLRKRLYFCNLKRVGLVVQRIE